MVCSGSKWSIWTKFKKIREHFSVRKQLQPLWHFPLNLPLLLFFLALQTALFQGIYLNQNCLSLCCRSLFDGRQNRLEKDRSPWPFLRQTSRTGKLSLFEVTRKIGRKPRIPLFTFRLRLQPWCHQCKFLLERYFPGWASTAQSRVSSTGWESLTGTWLIPALLSLQLQLPNWGPPLISLGL